MSEVTKETKDAVVTVVDAAISAFIQVSPLQIGIAAKNAYSSIKANHFMEKMEAMLIESNDISIDEKNRFLEFLDNDKDEFFRRLWIVLDRVDSKEKAIVIGKLFSAFIKQKIDKSSFVKLSVIIDASYYDDLKYLTTYVHSSHPQREVIVNNFFIKRRLSNAGLLEEEIQLLKPSNRLETSSVLHSDKIGISFKRSDLAEILIKYGF
jgi:hypothetical protein